MIRNLIPAPAICRGRSFTLLGLAVVFRPEAAVSAAPLPDLPPGVSPDTAIQLTTASAGLPSAAIAPDAVTVDGSETKVPAKGGLTVPHPGYSNSDITLRYTLGKRAPGIYDVWTAFNLGGVAVQSFTLKAGPNPGTVTDRASWSQSNGTSWLLEWRKADVQVTLYPYDKVLEIHESGRASGAKALAGVVLNRVGELPADLDEMGTVLRLQAAAQQSENPPARVYILESGSAAASNPYYSAVLDELGYHGSSPLWAQTFYNRGAAKLAEQLGVKLPAMIVMDDHYAVREIAQGGKPSGWDDRVLEGFSRNSQLDPIAGPKLAGDFGVPIKNGVPGAWLVAGPWGGTGGLSLYGLGAEELTAPQPHDPVIVTNFDRVTPSTWEAKPADDSGVVTLSDATPDFGWSRGTAYACLYLKANAAKKVLLRVNQSGIRTFGLLKGKWFVFKGEGAAAQATMVTGVTDQGDILSVPAEASQGDMTASLDLVPGWNRLLLKLITRQGKEARFTMAARLTEPDGSPVKGIEAALADPTSDQTLHAEAARLQPLISTDQPLNLPYPGRPLSLKVDLQRLPTADEPLPVVPLLPFRAQVEVVMKDYHGRELVRRLVPAVLPGTVTLPLGQTPSPGYYSVEIGIKTPDGRSIIQYPPDGFSVIGGTAAQRERQGAKKMACTYYWMNDGEKYKTLYLPYMERMGFFRNVGGHPGPNTDLYTEAQRRHLELVGDLWNFEDKAKIDADVAALAPYVHAFKSFNEVDIVPAVRGTPEHWTQVTKDHYEAVKAVAPAATVLSASLARPGADDWFSQCLALGMDKYVDIWDVHCYPQKGPDLEGTMSNSPRETELGVLNAYKSLGRTNDKPFWIGETGARASHGPDARRWQADTVAKMVACANSRPDFQVIGFLIPWQYSRERSRNNDIEAGHMPAEAAYYTAGALIDGFPYSRLNLGPEVQAAKFGPTVMLWVPNGTRMVELSLDSRTEYLQVDVVGRAKELKVPATGKVVLEVGTSPVYVLGKVEYERLTKQ